MDRLSCDSSGTLVRLFQRTPIFNAKNPNVSRAEAIIWLGYWVVELDHCNERLKNP